MIPAGHFPVWAFGDAGITVRRDPGGCDPGGRCAALDTGMFRELFIFGDDFLYYFFCGAKVIPTEGAILFFDLCNAVPIEIPCFDQLRFEFFAKLLSESLSPAVRHGVQLRIAVVVVLWHFTCPAVSWQKEGEPLDQISVFLSCHWFHLLPV